jgi:hypothetical protein
MGTITIHETHESHEVTLITLVGILTRPSRHSQRRLFVQSRVGARIVSDGSSRVRAERIMLRLIYLLFAIVSFCNGLWMLVFPLSWYADFPADIPHTGPFNPHFVRDLGVVYLVVALAFVWAARNIDRSSLVHIALTLFFVGHALLHLADIAAGRLPHSHWLIDMPGVFVPALLMTILAVPAVRRRLV